jgi:hypothetical protein
VLQVGDDQGFIEELMLTGVAVDVQPAPDGFVALPLSAQIELLHGLQVDPQVVWMPQPGAAQVVWLSEHRSTTRWVEVGTGPGSDAQLALVVSELLGQEPPDPPAPEPVPEPAPHAEPSAPLHVLAGVGGAASLAGPQGALTAAVWSGRLPGAVVHVHAGPRLQRASAGITWAPLQTRVAPRLSATAGAVRLSDQGYGSVRLTPQVRVALDVRLDPLWLCPWVAVNPVRDVLIERPDTLLVDTGRVEFGVQIGFSRKVWRG